jgi:hypothetical protein
MLIRSTVIVFLSLLSLSGREDSLFIAQNSTEFEQKYAKQTQIYPPLCVADKANL